MENVTVKLLVRSLVNVTVKLLADPSDWGKDDELENLWEFLSGFWS